MIVYPSSLTPGDKICIVAPAGKAVPERLAAAAKVFSSWGLNVCYGKHLYGESHMYMAGIDEERLSDMQSAMDDPEIRAIFCARGGYGVNRIIDALDFTAFKQSPKWLVGFSDITALHAALACYNIASIHATMPQLFERPGGELSVESLRHILFQGTPYLINAEADINNRLGDVSAPLIGGNLALLVDSIGTRYEVDTAGKILLLEEVGEEDYRVDRMLTHLDRAGKLASLVAVAIGYFTGFETTRMPFARSLSEVVLDRFSDYDIPIAFGFPVGHEEPNLAFLHGATYHLSITAEGTVLGA